ncbi:hypothetical protein DCAR_0101400 [Daucus carota subsp. sativus]|uniref:Uncharacterized protein n=1 Tax=Daucus carota subsp. sativus TaxID=79200 RepID=A0AAF0W600_DAUCS|nr:hypothetical protein DCAR_0101400 [Daucus carota subsp. sativus]
MRNVCLPGFNKMDIKSRRLRKNYSLVDYQGNRVDNLQTSTCLNAHLALVVSAPYRIAIHHGLYYKHAIDLLGQQCYMWLPYVKPQLHDVWRLNVAKAGTMCTETARPGLRLPQEAPFQNPASTISCSHAETSSLNSQPPEDVSLTRIPMSNITNEKESPFVQRRKWLSRASKSNLESTTRNLFDDSFANQEPSTKYFADDDIGILFSFVFPLFADVIFVAYPQSVQQFSTLFYRMIRTVISHVVNIQLLSYKIYFQFFQAWYTF